MAAQQGSSSSTTTHSPFPLQDRVAIVTGGSRGIGRAISLHLASLGARIVVNYTSNSDQADQVVAQINDHNNNTNDRRAIAFKADISNPDQVKSLFDTAESTFGSPLHIVVNSAGVSDSKYTTLATTALEDFDNVFNVNTRGAFLVCKEAANRIKQGGGGRIVCFSTSLVGALLPRYGTNAASKAAVEAMVKILAKELRGTGITANCVAPGPIATEMFYAGKTEEMVKRVADMSPLGRLGKTEDVAPMVGFLVSDAGEWVNGQTVRLNGGFI